MDVLIDDPPQLRHVEGTWQQLDILGGGPRTSLRHDAAEAILLGLWAVVEVGWLPGVPEVVTRG